MVVLDGDEKEYDAGDEDIDKEDKELDKFILDDWDFISHFIGLVDYLIFATCLSLYSNTHCTLNLALSDQKLKCLNTSAYVQTCCHNCRAEAMSNSEKIKPVALAVIELRLSEGISQSVTYLLSQ